MDIDSRFLRACLRDGWKKSFHQASPLDDLDEFMLQFMAKMLSADDLLLRLDLFSLMKSMEDADVEKALEHVH